MTVFLLTTGDKIQWQALVETVRMQGYEVATSNQVVPFDVVVLMDQAPKHSYFRAGYYLAKGVPVLVFVRESSGNRVGHLLKLGAIPCGTMTKLVEKLRGIERDAPEADERAVGEPVHVPPTEGRSGA